MRADAAKVTLANKGLRVGWNLVWWLFYRPTPTFLYPWRRFLLRLFGAKIGPGAHCYPSARVWAPWNLTMGRDSCLANHSDCYNVARVILEDDAIVSQKSYLCSAGHDYQDPAFTLVAAPIVIQAKAWVAADAFIGPGVTVGTGAVVGARAVVTRDVPPWTVVAGNPAKVIKARQLPGAEKAAATTYTT